MKKLSEARPQRKNANRHSQRGMGLLESSIQQDGWIGAITVAADGETFDGSARLEVGAATGFEDAIVVDSDGTKPVIVRRQDIPTADDPRAVRLGIAANRVAQLNLDWSPDLLAQLREQDGILEGLFRDDELDVLLADLNKPEPGGGGDDFDTTPTDGPTRVQRGEVWRIGEHRLMCGDSTCADDVARLMQGEKALLMWTDPPYGVDYVGKTKDALTLENDDKTGLEGLLTASFIEADAILEPGAAIYVAHPPGALSVVFGNCFISRGWRLHQTLAWVKDSMVLGHSDYHYKHEPILYGYKQGEGRFGRGGKGWYGDHSQVSVLEVPRPKVSEEHPTMKPVGLIEICIKNSSPHDGIIVDPFAGSGSTLIAAHRLGRRARLCDIDPKYCDVILRRAEAEGIGPIERVSDGPRD